MALEIASSIKEDFRISDMIQLAMRAEVLQIGEHPWISALNSSIGRYPYSGFMAPVPKGADGVRVCLIRGFASLQLESLPLEHLNPRISLIRDLRLEGLRRCDRKSPLDFVACTRRHLWSQRELYTIVCRSELENVI